jgi:uncharacterized membrane protein
MTSAVLVSAMVTIDHLTHGWQRRRWLGILFLALVGLAAAGVPAGLALTGWLLGAVVIMAAAIAAYVTLLRFDPTMVPLAVGTMVAVTTLIRGAERAYAGALTGSIAGAVIAAALGWCWFRLLRRARARVAG